MPPVAPRVHKNSSASARSWMNHRGMSDRRQSEYITGVQEFLSVAFSGKEGTQLKCPCINCNLTLYQDQETMWEHLMAFGILSDYNPWVHHGESVEESHFSAENEEEHNEYCVGEDMASLVFDATYIRDSSIPQDGQAFVSNSEFECGAANTEVHSDFQKLMEAIDAELYPGCRTFKKLEFIITLLHIKVTNRWSDKSFQSLLETLHKAFNYADGFPKSSYEARKYTRALGLDYVKIDACVNHCILFRKEYALAKQCPKCGAPRWKQGFVQGGDIDADDNGCEKESRVPQLVLRHFPLIPRLQRMFMSSKLAKHMRWHKEERPDDGLMRHPADSKAWKHLDELYPEFAADPRNIRLALSTDGFNPGANFSSKYSIWPVTLVPYNLPPWMCMKRSNFLLALLIPGPKAPGNDIDVFLEPLIDEFKELWEVGVKTYDAHSKEMFDMSAVLIWTMQDFPAYANLSGWSTKGFLACPNCHKDTFSHRLKHGRKWCYMGHRRFLELDHPWRLNRRAFGGKIERGAAPQTLSGHDILEQWSDCGNVEFGKADKGKRKRGERYLLHQWKKKSIFFELPYWRHLLIRHNLDVMHVEKNVCDNILGTLLEIPGKNKDSLNARLDLIDMNMHEKLRVRQVGDKYQIPKAPYNLTLAEKRQAVTLLSKLVVPDSYSSNITRCVTLDDGKIQGMKSHDCHIFMQDLLIPTFRGILDDKVLEPLAELSLFFKQLCCKTLKVEILEEMEKSIAVTLCKLERIFIPAFFDVMVHLVVHLATEAKLAGPVPFRWQYPFERDMHTNRLNVRNKARPEGSMAEAYVANECLTFCSRYLSNIETQFNRVDRNDDIELVFPHQLSIFSKLGKPLGKPNVRTLTLDEYKQAQMYVLRNCEEAEPFLNDYENRPGGSSVDLCDWFNNRIANLWKERDGRVSEELFCLAQGPLKCVICYEGYIINGFRFHTRKRQRKRKTQNSGVVVKGDVESGEADFYGVLDEVILLEYNALKDRRSPKVVLFKCKWFDIYNKVNGVKVDKFGVTSVNVSRRLPINEPFALGCQVGQVFYVPTHNAPQWRVVVKTTPRNHFDFPADEDDNYGNIILRDMVEDEVINILQDIQEVNNEDIPLVRDDIAPDLVEARFVAQCREIVDDADVDGGEGDTAEQEQEESEFSDSGSSIGAFDVDLQESDFEDEAENDESN